MASMQTELAAEQNRISRGWSDSLAGWEKLQAKHEALQKELAERRVEAEAANKALRVEASTTNATMAAEVQMLSEERSACREERRALGVALLQHKQEVSQHRDWLFGAMQTMQQEREQGVYQIASEGAKLDAQKRAAELSQRNASYERSVVAKEREALAERRNELQAQREEAARDRQGLAEAEAKLKDAHQHVNEKAREAEEQRIQVTRLAEATAQEAQLISERQRQLREQAAELLRGATSERVPPPATSAAAPVDRTDALFRANYTASGLGLFTIPLVGSRVAGLPSETMETIETATFASTSALAARFSAQSQGVEGGPPSGEPRTAWESQATLQTAAAPASHAI